MSILSSENSSKTELSAFGERLGQALLDSAQYRELVKAVMALDTNGGREKLSELNRLQTICRLNEKNPRVRSRCLKEIQRLKSELFQDPLWTNYLSAYKSFESLFNEMKDILEGE